MKAMVLAAGVGSRLRPLTDTVPKALVDIGGMTMLERVVGRLVEAGATDIVVNAFHHADQLARFIETRGPSLGARFKLSAETTLLDTGGGLKNASWFFDDGKPFFVHNVDVVSDVNLRGLMAAHEKSAALATLAVHRRPTKRALMFDRSGRLLGRAGSVPAADGEELAFSGISAISPGIFSKMTESGVFSLTDCFVRLATREPILSLRCDGGYWTDIGDQQKLEAARRRLQS